MGERGKSCRKRSQGFNRALKSIRREIVISKTMKRVIKTLVTIFFKVTVMINIMVMTIKISVEEEEIRDLMIFRTI